MGYLGIVIVIIFTANIIRRVHNFSDDMETAIQDELRIIR